MKNIITITVLILLVKSTNAFTQFDVYSRSDFEKLSSTHDIPALLNWGPYSKKYAGISHIPDISSGMRFDITIVPGFYRNRVMVPNVLFESGYYPWNINANMSQITYRYELEWKDRVYIDATYTVLDSSSVLVGMKCVNNTELPQVLQLNLLASLNYPDVYPANKAVFPGNVKWKNALEYYSLEYAVPRPSDNLVYNGWLRGEEREDSFLEGRGLGCNFGSEIGDKVFYHIDVANAEGSLALYCKIPALQQAKIRLSGLINKEFVLEGHGKFELYPLAFKVEKTGKYDLIIESEGNQPFKLNGFFIGGEEDIENIKVNPQKKNIYPDMEYTPDGLGVILKYPDVGSYYSLSWNFSPSVVRQVLDSELDIIFRKYVHEHNYKVFYGDSLGHYSNVFMRPVEVQPVSEQTVYALISKGTKKQVSGFIEQFHQSPGNFVSQKVQSPDLYKNILPEGEKYKFGINMMQAALLSNIVYPIYTQNQYIRHFTPGKWWNSLYTWDSGFESLGMEEIDLVKAIEILNAYTTPPGSQSAFIHHGSPVPVQVYAFYDFWNKTQSKELLDYFYPRLKQYYKFLVGEAGSSTTRTFHSNLLRTWEYFYNSGGWDDYPPQKAVRDNSLEKTVSPVITTAQCIRFAKILRKVAEVKGLKGDIKEYDKDIVVFSEALQKYAWDPQSSYFSYVVHDSLNNPVDILKYPASGQNYNMGLDGAYPLFSGICTDAQKKVLLDKIFSPDHMWTPAGICVVEKEAAYYRNDGYWNGAVWMPHQWFMWKTMFDLGEPDLAFKIANTALELWKKETGETYFTYEHFIADIARGAGWHQFGALSAPVLNWFASYYRPGTVTTGFEVWIDSQQFNPDYSAYNAKLSFDGSTDAHKRSIVVCMDPDYQYEVFIDGQKSEVKNRFNGLLEIDLPASNKPCGLEVKPVNKNLRKTEIK